MSNGADYTLRSQHSYDGVAIDKNPIINNLSSQLIVESSRSKEKR